MDNTTQPMAKTAGECSARLRHILVEGDLSQGEGLPEGCTRAAVDVALDPSGVEGRGVLSGVSRRWLKYPVPGRNTQARVWLGDGERVLLIDVLEPGIKELPASLRKRLGEPAEIIMARVNPTNSEWIYPTHGITVAVGNRGDAESTPERITYLFLYAPTSLTKYVDELGGKDEWVRRLPQRR